MCHCSHPERIRFFFFKNYFVGPSNERTFSYHSTQFGHRFVHTPTVFGKCFRVGERKQFLIVSQREGVHVQLFEYGSSGVVLLFVRETQISHVFAEYVDAVGVFASGTRAANLFHSRHNAQRYIHDDNWIFFGSWLWSEVKAIICYGQNASGWAAVRTNVSTFVLNILTLLTSKICKCDGSIVGNLWARFICLLNKKWFPNIRRFLTIVSTPCFEFNEFDLESESTEFELACCCFIDEL